MGEFNRRASRHQTNGKRKSKRAFSVWGFRQEGNIKKNASTHVYNKPTRAGIQQHLHPIGMLM